MEQEQELCTYLPKLFLIIAIKLCFLGLLGLAGCIVVVLNEVILLVGVHLVVAALSCFTHVD